METTHTSTSPDGRARQRARELSNDLEAALTFPILLLLFLAGFAWARGGVRGQAHAESRLRGLMVVFGVLGVVDAAICAMAFSVGDSFMASATAVLVAVNVLLLWVTYRRVAR